MSFLPTGIYPEITSSITSVVKVAGEDIKVVGIKEYSFITSLLIAHPKTAVVIAFAVGFFVRSLI